MVLTKWTQNGPVLREVHGTRRETHNALNGSPVFTVRLECPYINFQYAISSLLGNPEPWPFLGISFLTTVKNLVAVAINVVSDEGAATTDVNGQVLNYQNMLFDVTYIPRIGQYVTGANGASLYMEDSSELRNESKPENFKNLVWGTTVSPSDIPANPIPIHPDESPQKFEPGQTITHTIEGWTKWHLTAGDEIRKYIGTVNHAEYVSVSLNETFPIGTLMLRSYTATKAFSFISYRLTAANTYYGIPTTTLKLNYEYRPKGWNKFWRNLVDGTSDYYYMLKNDATHGRYEPFKTENHDPFLKYTVP